MTFETERFASRACGRLQLHCQGERGRVSMRHCIDCQRPTGSVFSAAAFFDRGAVSVVEGASKIFARGSASGKPVRFNFCPNCGSTVFWEAERMPHLIGVAVGAFADSFFPQPEQSVFTRHKRTWLDLPDEMHVFVDAPPQRRQTH